MRNGPRVSLLSFVCAVLAASAGASPLTPGDYLQTEDATRTISEHRLDGSLVQTFHVPLSSDPSAYDGGIHDVAVDGRGNLHVYDGTAHGAISNLDVATGVWSHILLPNLVAFSVGNYGKLAISGDYLFATTQDLTANSDNGIYRVDLRDGSFVRFGEQDENDAPIDLTIGGDGLLYAFDGEGSPSGRFIESYDPSTLALRRHVELPEDFLFGGPFQGCQLHVDEAGDFFVNGLYGPVYKFSPGMDVLASYAYHVTGYVDDMDVRRDGTVLITQGDGRTVLLDRDFQTLADYDGSGQNAGRFGAWVPQAVPEPASLAAFALGALFVRRRRR